jgi:hypothetical protein
MGQHVTTMSCIHINAPSRCMVLQVTGRKQPQQQVLLLPVTPATMPNPQSPLCVMLNDSQNLPWALKWAWPPIRPIESVGVLNSNIESFPPERKVTLETTFAHALPRNLSTDSRHLVSFIAVETPGWFPVPSLSTGTLGHGSTFEFSESWMKSVSRTEGCAVVGYFRYLHHADERSEETETMRYASRVGERVVGVVDHYVYKSFRSEARALMLLRTVLFYVQQLGAGRGTAQGQLTPQPKWVVMRCKS